MSKFKRIMSFLLVVLMILPIFLSTGSVLAKEMTEKPVITQENPNKKEKEEVVIVDKTKDKSGKENKEEPQEDKVTIIDSEEENKETEVKEDKKQEVKEEKKESKEEPQDNKKEEVKEDIKVTEDKKEANKENLDKKIEDKTLDISQKDKILKLIEDMPVLDEAQDINKEILKNFIINYEGMSLEDMAGILQDNSKYGLDREMLDQQEYLKENENLDNYEHSYEDDYFYNMLIDLYNLKIRNIENIFEQINIPEVKEPEMQMYSVRSVRSANIDDNDDNIDIFKNLMVNTADSMFTYSPIGNYTIVEAQAYGFDLGAGSTKARLSDDVFDSRQDFFSSNTSLTLPSNVDVFETEFKNSLPYYAKSYFTLDNVKKIREINIPNNNQLKYVNINLWNSRSDNYSYGVIENKDPYKLDLNISNNNLRYITFEGLVDGSLNISNMEAISGKFSSNFKDFNIDSNLKAIGPYTFSGAFDSDSPIEFFKENQGESLEYIGEGAFTTHSDFYSQYFKDNNQLNYRLDNADNIKSNFTLHLDKLKNIKFIGSLAFSIPGNKDKQNVSLENLDYLVGVGSSAFYETPREHQVVLRNLPSLKYFGTPNYIDPRSYPADRFLSSDDEVEIFNKYFGNKGVTINEPRLKDKGFKSDPDYKAIEQKKYEVGVQELIDKKFNIKVTENQGGNTILYNTLGSVSGKYYIELSKIVINGRKDLAYDDTELIADNDIFNGDRRSPYGADDGEVRNQQTNELIGLTRKEKQDLWAYRLVVENTPNLELLDLSSSLLTNIEFKDDLPNIKSIDASANRLQDLDLRPLTSMSRINNKAFANNLLTCINIGSNISNIRDNAFIRNRKFEYADESKGYYFSNPSIVNIAITGGNIHNLTNTQTYTIYKDQICPEMDKVQFRKVDDTGKWNPLMNKAEFTAYYLSENKVTSVSDVFKQVMSIIRIQLVKQEDGSFRNYNSSSSDAIAKKLPNGNISLHQKSLWIDVGSDKKTVDNIQAFNDWENMRRYDINLRTGGVHTLKTGADFEKNIKDASQVSVENMKINKKQENGRYWIQVEGDFIFNPNTMPSEDYLLKMVKLYKNTKNIEDVRRELNNLILQKYTMSSIENQFANQYYAAFLGISSNKNVLEEIKRLSSDASFENSRLEKPTYYLYATTFLENKEIKKKTSENKYIEKHYLPNPQTPDEWGYLNYNIGGTYKEVVIKETKVPYGYEPKSYVLKYDQQDPKNNIFVNVRKPAKYEVRYLEEGTNRPLAQSKYGEGKYSDNITENAIDINGYELVGEKSQSFTLLDVDNTNVIIFYYKPNTPNENKTLTINYLIENTNNYVPDISPNPIFKENVKEGQNITINYPNSKYFVPVENQDTSLTIGKEKNTIKNIYYKPVYANYQIKRWFVSTDNVLQPYQARAYELSDYEEHNKVIHRGYHKQEVNVDNFTSVDDPELYLFKDNAKLKEWGLDEYTSTVTLDKDKLTVINLYYGLIEGTKYKVNYWLVSEGQDDKLVHSEEKVAPIDNPEVKDINTDKNSIFKNYTSEEKNQIKFRNMDKQLPFTPSEKDNVINVYYIKENKKTNKNILVKKIDDNNQSLAGATISIYKKLEGDQSYERYIKEKPLQSIETKDNGLALFENVDSDIVILETKSVEGFNLNREVKSVNIASYNGEEIIFKNHKITTKLPKTGTLGILPYILVSGLSVGMFIKLKKSKED